MAAMFALSGTNNQPSEPPSSLRFNQHASEHFSRDLKGTGVFVAIVRPASLLFMSKLKYFLRAFRRKSPIRCKLFIEENISNQTFIFLIIHSPPVSGLHLFGGNYRIAQKL